jgi:hypothetical protein
MASRFNSSSFPTRTFSLKLALLCLFPLFAVPFCLSLSDRSAEPRPAHRRKKRRPRGATCMERTVRASPSTSFCHRPVPLGVLHSLVTPLTALAVFLPSAVPVAAPRSFPLRLPLAVVERIRVRVRVRACFSSSFRLAVLVQVSWFSFFRCEVVPRELKRRI